MTTTPRVAESLDDLRVGMAVAWQEDEKVKGGTIDRIVEGYAITSDGLAWDDGSGWPLTVLQDPPPEPEPVRVPSELIDALAEALDQHADDAPCPVAEVANALLDAARNGTDQ